MVKTINYKGKTLEIIVVEKYDMNEPYYDYWIRELIIKGKWKYRVNTIIKGSTFWWDRETSFETRIMKEIEDYYDTLENQDFFKNSVENFFNNEGEQNVRKKQEKRRTKKERYLDRLFSSFHKG